MGKDNLSFLPASLGFSAQTKGTESHAGMGQSPNGVSSIPHVELCGEYYDVKRNWDKTLGAVGFMYLRPFCIRPQLHLIQYPAYKGG